MPEFWEVVYGRRSIRRYTREDVPDDLVTKVLDAARWAPSAGNLQPWLFYVVRNESVKRELYRAAYGQEYVLEAPVVLVVATDRAVSASVYGERGWNLYAVQDASAAIENLLLAVHAQGLGAVWIGAFNDDAVRRAIGIRRESVSPMAIIPVGWPAESPVPPRRRSLEDITKWIT